MSQLRARPSEDIYYGSVTLHKHRDVFDNRCAARRYNPVPVTVLRHGVG